MGIAINSPSAAWQGRPNKGCDMLARLGLGRGEHFYGRLGEAVARHGDRTQSRLAVPPPCFMAPRDIAEYNWSRC